jgi:hypothetical protein
MTDPLLYAQDCAKPKSEEWRKGPRITLEDCVRGTGSMQKMAKGELHGKTQGAVAKSATTQRAKPATMGFGKFRERLLVDVYEQDRRYFDWCLENVNGFKKRWNTLQDTAL